MFRLRIIHRRRDVRFLKDNGWGAVYGMRHTTSRRSYGVRHTLRFAPLSRLKRVIRGAFSCMMEEVMRFLRYGV